MADKAAQLVHTLESHENDLEQSELRDYVNDVLQCVSALQCLLLPVRS